MTAGIPGTGISVLFYLLSILMMSIDMSVTAHKRSHAEKCQLVGRQLSILAGAALSVCLMSWLLHWGVMRSPGVLHLWLTLDDALQLPLHPWVIGLATLTAMLLGIELLSLYMQRDPVVEAVDADRALAVHGQSVPSASFIEHSRGWMTSRLFWIALPALVVLVAVANRPQPAVRVQDQISMYSTEPFLDEFNGERLDTDQWLIAYKQWGGHGANGGVVPENVRVADGKLIIAGHGNRYQGPVRGIDRDFSPRSDGKRVGGAIATRAYFASGRYEVRMKIIPQFGAVSAIWTLQYAEYYRGDPQYIDKPVGSPDYYAVNHEIDIELPGRPGRAHTGFDFAHALFTTWVGENSDEHTVNYTKLGAPQNDGQFHTYRFDWHTGSDTQNRRVEFYVDDVWQHTTYTHVPTHAGRLWVGVWFPAAWAGAPDFDTEYLEVDWVRITPSGEAGDRWRPEAFPTDGWADAVAAPSG